MRSTNSSRPLYSAIGDKQNTMTIQEAIQKAVEGGYTMTYMHQGNQTCDVPTIHSFIEEALLSPLFWQALGKSMGWEQMVKCKYSGSECVNPKHTYACHVEWLFHWHRLIDHLAEGKSIEDYFNNL